MPVAARMDGISIEFYPTEHPTPHFHARYGKFIARINIRHNRVLRGSLPPAQPRKVLERPGSRQQLLMKAWLAVEEKRKAEKIDE